MRANRIAVATLAAVAAIAFGEIVGIGQQAPGANPAQSSQPQVAAPLPLGCVGEAVYPSFEGWGPIKNGQNYILIGYYNRNKDQTIDIPIGPNNHIDPGGPDLLQPTHFEPGRAWGVTALAVPKDFGSKKFTWTLVANGKPAVVQYWMNPPYWVDYYKNAAKGNTPPVIKFSETGPELTGPPTSVALNLTATVNQPLTLKLWAKDKPNTYDPEDTLPPEQRSRGRGRGRGTTDNGAAADPNAATGRGAARGRGATDNQNWDFSAATGRSPAIGRGAGGGGRGRGTGPQPDITVTWKV